MDDVKTIVIADDHPFVASGLASALNARDGFSVAGIATNGIEAIAMIKRLSPDCAVLDIHMPGANGIETLAEVRRWSPATRVVILTGSSNAATFRDLVELGAQGIFLKNENPQDICDGICTVACGGAARSAQVDQALASLGQAETLTARELEVLHGISRGMSNTQLADRLGVSPKTVDSHRTSLMRKLGVHTTATLLVRAMRDGLIDAGGLD
ncbi:MAG TPA: response regulator transcription factor [Rhizobiaceae bacterium]|nr:response regulator transcription factor [Rhizobiaceae bacterium]